MAMSGDSLVTSSSDRAPVLVDFALQGGGSHGAFTWGVLDRLLEEPWLKIDGISGTSAGAMNAAVLADGFAEGGAEGARAALERYWRYVSEAARFSPFQRSPLDRVLGRWTLDHSPLFVTMDIMSRLFSPYDLNPRGSNPLRGILEKLIDFERLQGCADQAVHHRHQCAHRAGARLPQCRDHAGRAAGLGLSSDDVSGGRDRRRDLLGRRLFRQSDDDAARSTNCDSKDTILIPINPLERPGTPKSARATSSTG